MALAVAGGAVVVSGARPASAASGTQQRCDAIGVLDDDRLLSPPLLVLER